VIGEPTQCTVAEQAGDTILGAVRQVLMIAVSGLILAGCSSSSAASSSPTPSAAAQSNQGQSANLPVVDPSCNSEATSQSLNSNTPTSFTLTNHTSETLSLFWLNFQGQRVHYTDVDPGQSKDQKTFVTHPWVVADPGGNCIRLFLVTTHVTITIG
jgi:hypothetical protein